MSDISQVLLIRELGLCEYQSVFEQMQQFSVQRTSDTPDQIWLLQHKSVYTLGKNGKPHHILNAGVIPIIQVDRGGQVTYHGPGQLIVYLLLDVKRKGLGVRQIVSAMEYAVIRTLAGLGIHAEARAEAPGVYVADKKIAALGLRIKNGKSYHGLSVNLDMDLTPFQDINPCGYQGMQVTQLKDLTAHFSSAEIARKIIGALAEKLGYISIIEDEHNQSIQ